MRKYACGAYERLSKEDLKKLKTDESMSIENQRLFINSFCKYNDLEIVAEYVDDGYTGSDFERPAFEKLIEDIENGKINCVITKDLSRLGRELYQTGRYIEDYFADKDVRYIAINDNYDSLVGDPTLSMKLTYNDYLVRDTSRKVKSIFTAKQRAGDYIGSFPRYGYMKDPNKKNHLIIDPVASVVVKKIYEMALQGIKCNKIADTLTKEKIPIPIVYKKETRGLQVTDNGGYGIWRHQTVKDILTSEMYIGNMVQNICNKIRYNSKKKRATKKEDYIIVPDTHDPIIDKNTFDKVQQLINSTKKIVTKNKNTYLFGGLLKCKECGHNISILKRKSKTTENHHTQCNSYSKKGKYGICNIHRVNYDWLENDLIQVITDISQSFLKEYNNKLLTEEVNNIIHEDLEDINNLISMLGKDIFKYEKTIKQLYMDKVEGKIPEDIFSNLMNKYNEDLNVAKSRKEEAEKKKDEIISSSTNLDYDLCAKKVSEFINTKKLTPSLISELVEKVEIDNDKNIKIYFNFTELSVYAR
ncbi:MAG: recombinase family protein [Eubacteriales bacterium]|nr:recombinase family protein [Eubacteriales bacterium]